jgi:ADP-heptose:LPS heptosyltransferase
MFRNLDDHKKYGITTVNCLIADNGLGDLLCSLMPINYIIKNSPWINLLIWVPDFMVDFAKNVLPEKSIIRGYSEAKKKYDNTRTAISTKSNNQHSPMRTHPTKFAYHVLCDMEPTLDNLSYLKIDSSKIDIDKFTLPNNIVAIQGAYTEIVKTMPVETFNKLVDYIIEKGYTPVFLGKTENKSGIHKLVYKAKVNEEYDLAKGINLLNKTNLLESAKIIETSKLFIGIDGGLSHLAGFTNTNILAGYTFASNDQLMPTRNSIFGDKVFSIVPDESLKCRFCQTNFTLLFNNDMRNCLYKDFECVKHMTFEKFKKQIDDNNLL